jgi:hypothetical protein
MPVGIRGRGEDGRSTTAGLALALAVDALGSGLARPTARSAVFGRIERLALPLAQALIGPAGAAVVDALRSGGRAIGAGDTALAALHLDADHAAVRAVVVAAASLLALHLDADFVALALAIGQTAGDALPGGGITDLALSAVVVSETPGYAPVLGDVAIAAGRAGARIGKRASVGGPFGIRGRVGGGVGIRAAGGTVAAPAGCCDQDDAEQ